MNIPPPRNFREENAEAQEADRRYRRWLLRQMAFWLILTAAVGVAWWRLAMR